MLNYSIHASESLTNNPLSSKVEHEASSLLTDAAKFCLPPNGTLLDGQSLLSFISSDIIRLPYPVVSLEFYTNCRNDVTTKHIVLCIDYESSPNNIFSVLARKNNPQIDITGGIIVVPISSKINEWELDGAIAVLYKKSTLNSNYTTSIYWNDERRLLDFNIDILPVTLTAMMFAINNSEHFTQHFTSIVDVHFIALWHTLVCLSCTNISFVKSPAPDKLNKKRIASGKRPLDEYRTIVINNQSHKSTESRSTMVDGSPRRLPREHMRRGHIRSMSSGKRIWINNMVIAAGRNRDKVQQTYKLVA